MNHSFTAIIVDDEPLSIDIIAQYLEAFPQVNIIGRCSKSRLAVDKIIALKPDLLFLDIHMPGMNGFELIDAVASHHNPYIIFITAFDKYAIRAFEVNAIGYLLKPFLKEKFNAAVEKFLAAQREPSNPGIYQEIIKMIAGRHDEPMYMERMLIKEQKKMFYLPVADIMYFEAQGDYVNAVTAQKNYLLSDSLTALEGKLAPDSFIRIHRSFTINASYVREFIPYFNNEYHIVMQNGQTLKMSRHYRENLLRVFTELK